MAYFGIYFLPLVSMFFAFYKSIQFPVTFISEYSSILFKISKRESNFRGSMGYRSQELEVFLPLIYSGLAILIAYVIHRLSRSLMDYQTRRVQEMVQVEKKDKQLGYKHVEEMEKIKNLHESNKRKDELDDKKFQMNHELSSHGQEQLYSILKDTFGKVKEVDLNQAVYSACVLQSMQTGKAIDNVVLGTVASKVPTPVQMNLEQIVENVIQRCDDGEYDTSYDNAISNVEPTSHNDDLFKTRIK